MNIEFTVRILGVILSSLILVSGSRRTDCQPGTVLKSVFEQNCAGQGWVGVSVPNLLSGSCKKRRSFACVPLQGSKSNQVGNGQPKKGPGCKTVYVQKCNRHGGPTACVVVPSTTCGQPAKPKDSFFSGGGFNDEGSTGSEMLKGNAGSCSTRVRYLTQCREDRDPRCSVVAVPETDCSEDEDLDDGFDKEDTVVKTLQGRDRYKGIDTDRGLGVTGIRDRQHFEPFTEYGEDEHKTGKSGCKMVESCKTVPKRVCGRESGDDVYCQESAMEDCEVSVENTSMELCHPVVDKICKPAPYLQPGEVKEHGPKVVCRYVDVYMCTTKYEVETLSGVRSSCIQVPRVKCNAIPDHYGYKKHSKSCIQVNERICRKFSVVEPQPKANSQCGYKKVKSCYYQGGNPVKSSELVKCEEIEKNLCGRRETKDLVPDVCTTDVHPHCQYAEEKNSDGCRNVMKEECRMIEKC